MCEDVNIVVVGRRRNPKRVAGDLPADPGWPAEWVIDLGGLATARVPEAFLLLIRPLLAGLGPVPFGMSIAR